MNQEKIGKFIATNRKAKGLTQQELANMLGVTDRSISNWKNGKNMPDLSLFKPLCEILDITVNELLSGEKIEKREYQDKFEENLVNTIKYSVTKVNKYNQLLAFILIIFGLFVSLSAIMIFPSESSWGSIYSTLGIIIFVIGISRFLTKMKWYKKLLIILFIFISTMGVLVISDYVNVISHDEAPMFRIKTTYTGNVIYYDTLFYDVYRCYHDTEKEYWHVQKNHHNTTQYLINYCK